MDNKFQTSFIPQKPMTSEPTKSSSGINLFLLISIVIFIVSLLATAGVYFLKLNLNSQIGKSAADLVSKQKDVDSQLVSSLISLDNLLYVSNDLLSRHVAISPLFQFLQANTIVNLRFKDFNFSYGNEGKILVKMSGIAKDFNAIAAQSDAFSKAGNKSITNPIFSDFTPQSDGSVSFSFSAEINPSLISYSTQKNGTDQNSNDTTKTDQSTVNQGSTASPSF